MLIFESLMGLGGIFLLACCSPGPVFLLIASSAAHHGRVTGVKVALGVASATFLWSSLTLLGLGVLLASWVWAQAALRLIAGLYLLWLGFSIIRKARFEGATPPQQASKERSAFAKGFIASATNPKALAFFGSAFALTAPMQAGLFYQISAITMLTLLSALWHSGLALIFATPKLQGPYQGMKRQIDLMVGAILILLGGSLLGQALRSR